MKVVGFMTISPSKLFSFKLIANFKLGKCACLPEDGIDTCVCFLYILKCVFKTPKLRKIYVISFYE